MGWTQDEAARAIGSSASTIANDELGRDREVFDRLDHYEQAFEVDPGAVMARAAALRSGPKVSDGPSVHWPMWRWCDPPEQVAQAARDRAMYVVKCATLPQLGGYATSLTIERDPDASAPAAYLVLYETHHGTMIRRIATPIDVAAGMLQEVTS